MGWSRCLLKRGRAKEGLASSGTRVKGGGIARREPPFRRTFRRPHHYMSALQLIANNTHKREYNHARDIIVQMQGKWG